MNGKIANKGTMRKKNGRSYMALVLQILVYVLPVSAFLNKKIKLKIKQFRI